MKLLLALLFTCLYASECSWTASEGSVGSGTETLVGFVDEGALGLEQCANMVATYCPTAVRATVDLTSASHSCWCQFGDLPDLPTEETGLECCMSTPVCPATGGAMGIHLESECVPTEYCIENCPEHATCAFMEAYCSDYCTGCMLDSLKMYYGDVCEDMDMESSMDSSMEDECTPMEVAEVETCMANHPIPDPMSLDKYSDICFSYTMQYACIPQDCLMNDEFDDVLGAIAICVDPEVSENPDLCPPLYSVNHGSDEVIDGMSCTERAFYCAWADNDCSGTQEDYLETTCCVASDGPKPMCDLAKIQALVMSKMTPTCQAAMVGAAPSLTTRDPSKQVCECLASVSPDDFLAVVGEPIYSCGMGGTSTIYDDLMLCSSLYTSSPSVMPSMPSNDMPTVGPTETPDLCADVTCANGSLCVEGSCECLDGYTGDNCETAPTGGFSNVQFSMVMDKTLQEFNDNIVSIKQGLANMFLVSPANIEATAQESSRRILAGGLDVDVTVTTSDPSSAQALVESPSFTDELVGEFEAQGFAVAVSGVELGETTVVTTTVTPTTTTRASASSSEESSSDGGAIAGAVLGVIAFLAIVAGVYYYFYVYLPAKEEQTEDRSIAMAKTGDQQGDIHGGSALPNRDDLL